LQRPNPSAVKSGANNMETAKEAASRVIGKWGVPAIILIVGMLMLSAFALSTEALTPIVGLISIVVTALISLLVGITGTKDKEEKPEFKVIEGLIARLDQKEAPMQVTVDGDKVTVSKGHDTVTMKKED
jgi:hypothetical protein